MKRGSLFAVAVATALASAIVLVSLSTGVVGYFTSITIGTDGNPVISYMDSTNGDLKVARCNDPACAGQNEQLLTVDSAGTVGYSTSIALAPDGNEVVSYYDATAGHGDLKVARPAFPTG